MTLYDKINNFDAMNIINGRFIVAINAFLVIDNFRNYITYDISPLPPKNVLERRLVLV